MTFPLDGYVWEGSLVIWLTTIRGHKKLPPNTKRLHLYGVWFLSLNDLSSRIDPLQFASCANPCLLFGQTYTGHL